MDRTRHVDLGENVHVIVSLKILYEYSIRIRSLL